MQDSKATAVPRIEEISHSDSKPTERGNDFEPNQIIDSADDIISTQSRGISLTTETEDDLYYKINDDRKKMAVIFNHFKFRKRKKCILGDRLGTNKDCERMEKCLKEVLGFNLQVFADPNQRQILKVITDLSSKTSLEVSCIVVVVMTHGAAKGFLEAYDINYSKRILFEPFTREDTKLSGVPKLFFIQACRGANMDSGIEYDGSHKLPRHADLFVMYSTVEGYSSFREQTGSWLIQEVCEQLEKVHCKWHFLELMTFASGRVARDCESNTYDSSKSESLNSHQKKQMPQIKSTLTKLLDFSPGHIIRKRVFTNPKEILD